ncbi:hypothetical protein IFM89_019663 [Coptis chinensis]|uniref:Uncharacterized protein n=1 Tax=Coptis chinensis TaxID=261450 RepID=A0A835I4V2_9MAGN|nr:hypothetical protein IFM89_019663 [Coptis chinensis]
MTGNLHVGGAFGTALFSYLFARESLIKVPELPVLPFYKPVDYVEVEAQIHEELESCPHERSKLYLLQFQVFRVLEKVKLLRRSLLLAWQKASTIHEKIVFGAWLKYEKLGEELISELFASCGKCAQEFGPIDIASQLPIGMRAIRGFSETGSLNEICPDLLLELLIFSNKFYCERLKDACDRKLSSFVASREGAVDLMEYAIAENSNVLATSCLQVFLHDLPNCLSDDRVVRIFRDANRQHRAVMVGSASFSLYCLLSEVAMARDPCSDSTSYFLEQKEYDEAKRLFEAAVSAGHVYSVASLARLDFIKGWKQRSCDKLSSVIPSFNPLGWMYQERALYCEGKKKCDNLEKATELDPTLNYLYMYRAACLMRKQSAILTLSPEYRMFEGRVAATQLCTHVREHVALTIGQLQIVSYNYMISGLQLMILGPYQLYLSAFSGTLARQSLLLLRLNCPEAAMRSLQLARPNAASEHERLVYLHDT